jgi:hypothetical protein
MEEGAPLLKPVMHLVLMLAFAGAAPALWSQQAPYASRLTAQAGPQSVVLTWKDAVGFPGAKYEIWRSSKEIVKDGLSDAVLVGTVNAGVEAFEDKTITGPSFYLVLLRDAAGNRQGYYVPYKNKTLDAVQPQGAQTATVHVRVGAPTYARTQILIPFTASLSDRKLVVFRRAAPISGMADLKDATLLGNTTGDQAPFRDTPPPGLDFYYAILDAQAFADGKSDAFQPDSATDRGAGFPLVAVPDTGIDASLRPGVANTSRALPVPLLQVESAPETGAPLAPTGYEPIRPQPLDPETDSVLRQWAKSSSAPWGIPAPIVLPEERAAASDGAAKYLIQILHAYLEPKDWKGATDALRTVLKLTLDPRTEARARFYLGEALSYQKDYQNAFVEILSARDLYPNETRPFLDALLSLLGASKD